MKKIPLEILGLSPSHSESSNTFAMILSEIGGNRRLPIIIGIFEAQAIAIEIEKIATQRPMTHDLFKDFAEAFGIYIDEVVISDIVEGVFYSKLVGRTASGEKVRIDARPSDAIAIALRVDADIYVDAEILDKAGIAVDDKRDADGKVTQSKRPSGDWQEKVKHMSITQLKELLEQLLAREDYEAAAKVRDEINKRN